MPTYDYHCETCNQIFEVRASIQEKEAGLNPVCPNCAGLITRQIITAGMVLHPGSSTMVQNACCNPGSKSGCCG